MPRYLFAVRHPACLDLEDDPGGVELPDDAAARDFAVKLMRALAQHEDHEWDGWTMDVIAQGGRHVWQIPFGATEPGDPRPS
jgi:hypothetical protein